MLLSILNFYKALWQRASQYANFLDSLKSSEKFWKQLSNFIVLTSGVHDPSVENLTEMESLNLAYRYQCQSAIMEIMAYDIFLQKKLLDVELLAKQASESRDRVENSISAKKSNATILCDHKNILSSWCQTPVLDNLIKSLASYDCNNESYFLAKVTTNDTSFAYTVNIISLNM